MAWKLKGAWDKDPGAMVSVFLSQRSPRTNKWRDVATLAKSVPYDSRATTADLSTYRGKRYCITIRKDGDLETGGQSQQFDIE